MKVSDEMIDIACQRYADRSGHRPASGDMRVTLEAALADVPDPEQVRDEIMSELAYGRSVENQRLDARIRELEAQQPTTVLELTRRVTALQMKFERVREAAKDLLDILGDPP